MPLYNVIFSVYTSNYRMLPSSTKMEISVPRYIVKMKQQPSDKTVLPNFTTPHD